MSNEFSQLPANYNGKFGKQQRTTPPSPTIALCQGDPVTSHSTHCVQSRRRHSSTVRATYNERY